MTRLLLAALAALAIGGCSWLDAINPFSSGSKVKPAELKAFTPSAQLEAAWSGSVGSSGEFVLSPAVVGDTVIVAARDGSLTRYDSGKEAWRIKTGAQLSGGVGSDGSLIAVGTPKGEVLAYDGAGKELWKARVSSEVLSAPTVAEGLVLVRSGDNRIHALDAKDGKRKWLYQRSAPALTLRSYAGTVVRENLAFAGFPGGKLVALSLANGGATWEGTVALPKGATELERVADVTSPPAFGQRVVCAAAYQGRVACFDGGNGNLMWTRDISSAAGVDAEGRFVYVTDDGGAVHCLEIATGASVWKQEGLKSRGVSRPLALPGHVAVADAEGVVHLLRAEDGAFAARFTTDGSPVRADLQRAGDGHVVVQTTGGHVYALAVR